MKQTFILLCSILFFLTSSRTYAWGSKGHAIIAEIAFKNLDDVTKMNIENLLGGMTIEDASNWMDEIRTNHAYDFMKPWHYINIEKGENYAQSTEPNLVNEIINTQSALGNINDLSAEQIKTDLLVLFHLVGDLHQPLHCGYGVDKGGNTIKVNFMGESTNLHAMWDTKIIEEQQITEDDCIAFMDKISARKRKKIQQIDIVKWMNESRSYLDEVYGFDGHVLGEDYAKKSRTVIIKQLTYGGLRLAAILKKYFGNSFPQNL